MNKQTVDDAIGYLSFRMEELKQDDQFYFNIVLKHIDKMDEIINYIQHHPNLIDEFHDLINSDKDFNYNENEFIEWVQEIILNK